MLYQTSTPSLDWSFTPSVLMMLAGQATLYGFLIYLACKDGHWGTDVKLRHPLWFGLGLLWIFIALISPIDALSNTALLSAHMVQHILLAIVAPACLLLGTPRYWVRYVFEFRWLKPLLAVAVHPLIVIVIFNAVLWVWHLPALYEGALRDVNLHIVEHMMFLTTGVLLWLPVLHDVPLNRPLSYLGKIAYLFFTMISSSILGAIFTFSQSLIYTFYGNAPLAFGLSPMDDQQLAGAIMWVPGGGLLMAAIMITFAAWLQNEEHKGQTHYPPPPQVAQR
jgi:cytochrome c oxidase assembly factor CtaG